MKTLIETDLPKAFIPKNLYVKSDTGAMKRVKYVNVCDRRFMGNRQADGIYLEQYYHSNFASHSWTTIEELNKIDMVKTSDDSVALYREVFNK